MHKEAFTYSSSADRSDHDQHLTFFPLAFNFKFNFTRTTISPYIQGDISLYVFKESKSGYNPTAYKQGSFGLDWNTKYGTIFVEAGLMEYKYNFRTDGLGTTRYYLNDPYGPIWGVGYILKL